MEKILYDFNAENMEEQLNIFNSNQIKYRKAEKLQTQIHCLVWFFSFIDLVCLLVGPLVNTKTT